MATRAADRLADKQPRFFGMSHVSLPCRDLEESKLFYARVLGGELVHEIPGFFEYRITDMIFGLSEQPGGWTGLDDEYPHYAFYTDGENFRLMTDWLDRHGIPNHPYRRDRTALIYFRDPSGNLLEVYCRRIEAAAGFARGAKQGGDYAIDFAALNYRWPG
jgi:catechol 2,3-dioxygenase-like lactoylglutathione lyase family enzyme